MKLKRKLAVDLGSKRIGLALSDELDLGFPHTGSITVISSLEHSAKQILDWYSNYTRDQRSIDTILVGNPLSLDGKETKRSEISKSFCQKLEIELKARDLECISVILWDERLTSAESEVLMQEAGHRKIKGNNRRELKDQISAALILSSYVETMRNLNNKIL